MPIVNIEEYKVYSSQKEPVRYVKFDAHRITAAGYAVFHILNNRNQSTSTAGDYGSFVSFIAPDGVQNCDKLIFTANNVYVNHNNNVNNEISISYELYYDFGISNQSFAGDLLTSGSVTIPVQNPLSNDTTYLDNPVNIEIDITNLNLEPTAKYTLILIDNRTKFYYSLYFGEKLSDWSLYFFQSYTVTYNANGGNDINESTGFSNSFIVTNTIPTKNNSIHNSNFNIIGSGGDLDVSMTATKTDTIQHIFLGWNTDPLATEPLYTAGQEVSGITENITLYAIWRAQIIDTVYSNNTLSDLPIPEKSKSTKAYSITLDANGGTARTDIIYCAINIFYTFKEWVDQNNQPIDNNMQFTESTTVYASWIETNSGTINLPTATKEGCTFLGWSESKTGSDLVSNVYTPTKDCTLYAIYKSGYFIEGYIRLSNKWVKLE